MPVDTALIEALLVPIPGDNPAGADLRYDPRYDQIKEARREDLELPDRNRMAGERKLADWPLVVKLSRQLLEKETKDLQLAAWLSEALLKRDGLAGFATGLGGTRGIVDLFWETAYPVWDEEDPELRAGPIEWIGSRLDLAVRQHPIAPGVAFVAHQTSRTVPTEAEAGANGDKKKAREEAIKDGKTKPEEADRAVASVPKAYYKTLVAELADATTAVGALEKTCDERFGRDAPSFIRLRTALADMQRVADGILAQKLIDDPDPIAEEVVTEDGTTVVAVTVDGGPLPAEPVSSADAAARIGVAARYLRRLDPANPAPYLLLRGLRWGELRAGAGGEPNPKLLEAPPTAIRVRIKGLSLDGQWTELLELCETVMATPQGRGWLDLQRYVLAACAQLGYDAVAAAVRGEIRTLLAAVPPLRDMMLMDDTPTANPETQAWLDAEALAGGHGAHANGNGPGNSDGDGDGVSDDATVGDRSEVLAVALVQEDATSEPGGFRAGGRRRPGVHVALVAADPFAAARVEVAQGRPNRAIELLLAEIARERSPRGRFVRQTQIAYLMVEAGHIRVAHPLLEQLVATIDERKLEDWEAGPLVAQPLALLIRVIDLMAEMKDVKQAYARPALYLRICRLDPLQALALQPA